MAYETMVYVNNVALPRPSKYNPIFSDLDSSDTTRSETGVLYRNRVRGSVKKLELGFTVRSSVASQILQSMKPASLSIRAYDLESNTWITSTMYCSDRNATLKAYTGEGTIAEAIWELTFSLVEV